SKPPKLQNAIQVPEEIVGRTSPRHSPNPIRAKPGFSQNPRRATVSPSSRKERFSPVAKLTGAAPLSASSINAPASLTVGPDTVPVPSTSPTLRLQPLIVWCASIWAIVQYWCLKLVLDTRLVGTP